MECPCRTCSFVFRFVNHDQIINVVDVFNLGIDVSDMAVDVFNLVFDVSDISVDVFNLGIDIPDISADVIYLEITDRRDTKKEESPERDSSCIRRNVRPLC